MITINITAHEEGDSVTVKRLTVGGWLVYSAERGGCGHLYHEEGFETISKINSVSAKQRAQDAWAVRQFTKSAEIIGGRCEGCNRELSDPDAPPLAFYGVSRKTVTRAYVVCEDCATALADTTKLFEFVGERIILIARRRDTVIP